MESGNCQRHHENEPDGAERRHFRQRLDEEPAPPAGDMGAIHESRKSFVDFTGPLAALEHGEIDAGIDVEQHALDFRPPIVARVGKHVRHNNALRKSTTTRIEATRPALLPDGDLAGQ